MHREQFFASKPLLVDLDGPLTKTDLPSESASSFATRYPFQILKSGLWLGSGRSTLKVNLAETSEIDPALLLYNEERIAWLRELKADGRHLVLATASHRKLAEAIAWYLELFDEVLATEGDTNVKAKHKRDLLVSRFSEHGFDYVGDNSADLPLWKSAEQACVVSSSRAMVSRTQKQGDVSKVRQMLMPRGGGDLLCG